MTTHNINIVVSTKGAVTVKKDIDDIGKKSKEAGAGVDFLKGALTALISVQTIRTLSNVTSSLTDFHSRLALATGSADNASASMQRLFQLADMTYSSFDQTAEGFLRNHDILVSLGKSTEDVFNYTQALNDAIVVSGAKADEATRVQNALNKAMSTGRFEIEGLQTIMNSGARVAQTLADQLGVTVSELMLLENRSKLTSEVIYNSLIKASEDLRAEAENMPATIADGMLRIGTAMQQLIWWFDQSTGASSILAGALVFVADNMRLIALALTPVIAAFSLLAVTIIGGQVIAAFTSVISVMTLLHTTLSSLVVAIVSKVIPAIIGMATALVSSAIPAVVAFTTALATNPIFGVMAAATIASLYVFRDRIYEIGTAIQETVSGLLNLEQFGDFLNGQFNINVSMNQAAAAMRGAIEGGSRNGANAMKAGIEAGSASVGKNYEAIYESMNGKVIKPMGDVLVEGGKYIYNQITGAITKNANFMQGHIETGGKNAGETMEDHIVTGGQAAGSAMQSSLESAFITFANIVDILEVYLQRHRAEMRVMNAQAIKLQAEAGKINAERQAIAKGNGSGTRSSGSGGGGYAGGGGGSGTSFISGASWRGFNMPSDDQRIAQENLSNPNWKPSASEMASYHAANINRDTLSAIQDRFSSQTTSEPKLSVQNVVDPRSLVDGLETDYGSTKLVNVIKLNREEVLAALGSI